VTLWNQVCEVLKPIPNVLLQRVNEEDQHENRVDASLAQPAGLVSSNGSNGTGNDPPQPFWHYADLGAERRDGSYPISTTTVFYTIHGYQGEHGAPDWPGSHCATVNSEPPKLGKHVLDLHDAYTMGVGCQYGAGGTAHTESSLQGVLMSPLERDLSREFLRGVKAT
jgi:hypothetical protein